jgi:ABC-type multidrug transport system fused ATPase/permease subunit
LRRSTLGRSLSVLSKRDRKKVIVITFLQINLSVLDLLGVIGIGLLGALSVTGIQSRQPNESVMTVLQILHISELSFQNQAFVIAVGSVSLLVGRTILSIFFTRRILFFLSRRGADISANLVSRLLSQPLLKIQERTTQETLYAVTQGVDLIVLQVLATTVILISDLSLLVVMSIGLFVINPSTAIGMILFFTLIGYLLYRIMNVRASNLGAESTELKILSAEKIIEVFNSYREFVVRNRREYYARKVGEIRFKSANITAEINFMPFVSKYIIETSVVLGALLIAATQFYFQDASQAVATLSIFLAAGTRIAPSVLRVQQSLILIRSALGAAKPTLELIDELKAVPNLTSVNDRVEFFHKGFNSEIRIKNVSLTYPGKSKAAISEFSLTIPPGALVAFVGPSGAGKTTIIDVLLGVLQPDLGAVQISGTSPNEAVNIWPGSISYVPQDVEIVNGTIRQNVSLGYPLEEATDERVIEALKMAHLYEFVLELPQGLETQVGERGAKISGGQRQRLGIARAMFTKPLLLVLDEATSALDGETEASISKAILRLRGKTTVVMIAHRLSTVRNSDIVAYLSEGKIVAVGTFEEVRALVPDFDRHAKLAGL